MGKTTRFFVLALGLTWLLGLPALLAHFGLLQGPAERFLPLVGLGAFGPTVAAILCARREPGGVKALFTSGAPRSWRWWPLALVLPGAIFALGAAAYTLAGGEPGPWIYPPLGPERWVALVVFSVGEEIGWRGYALPRLLRERGPLESSLVLGVLWGLWHVPMFTLTGISFGLQALLILVFLPAGSVGFTWLYSRSGGSLWVAIALHMGAHLSNPHQPLPGNTTPAVIYTAAYVVFAVLVVLLDRGVFWPFAFSTRAGTVAR